MSDQVKGARGLKSSVRSNSHSTAGGHLVGKSNNSRAPIKQNSALSRVNRTRWDWFDGISGGEMAYQYQEYPKHIYTDPKNPKLFVVVNSVEEEHQVMGGEEILDEEGERSRLLAVAHVKKILVDKRWGPGKLTKAIEDAGFDPTLDPFK